MRLTPCLDLSALVTCHTLYVHFTCLQSAVFLLNSRMGHFTAPPGIALEDPFSRSYGAMLPSSLTRFLSRALVCLHPPTCVGFGTACGLVHRVFSGKRRRTASSRGDPGARRPPSGGRRGMSIAPSRCPSPNPPQTPAGHGMLTVCPSTTPFGLALGAD